MEIAEWVTNLYEQRFREQHGLRGPKRYRNPSPAHFIIRETDTLGDAHITLEICGKEFNCGPAGRNGFPIAFRIPLQRVA